MNSLLQRILNTLFIPLAFATSAIAQGPAGSGSDMWTYYMVKEDMFIPHDNNSYCDSSTEAFVSFTPDSKGYCIEKNERTATTWEEAREACLADGKRLPEPGEFVYACKRRTTLSLNNMIDNSEWVSNYTAIEQLISNGTSYVAVPTAGNGSCSVLSYGALGTNGGTSDSLSYRCVR